MNYFDFSRKSGKEFQSVSVYVLCIDEHHWAPMLIWLCKSNYYVMHCLDSFLSNMTKWTCPHFILGKAVDVQASDRFYNSWFQLLVREACQKALKTEQQAKQRLGQMIDDLNVHCRITVSGNYCLLMLLYLLNLYNHLLLNTFLRAVMSQPLQPPGVTFSRRIEERSIPSRDLSARP